MDTAILIFKTLAGMATIGLATSPASLVYRIYKQKHVGVSSVVPLAALFGSSHIWVLYGFLTHNYFPLVSCFLYGECCAAIFLSIYCYYSTDKHYVIRVLAVVFTIVAIVTIYAIIGSLGCTGQTSSSVNTIMGLIADCGGFCLYGAPMEKLFQVLKHKSAVFINVHMVVAGMTSNVFWLTYGLLITNWFIISLNTFFVAVNTFTLCLYRMYDPRTHPLQDGNDAYPRNDDNKEISVCIQQTPPFEAQSALTSIPSPVYVGLPSPMLELIH